MATSRDVFSNGSWSMRFDDRRSRIVHTQNHGGGATFARNALDSQHSRA
jgi:hypothetical protein